MNGIDFIKNSLKTNSFFIHIGFENILLLSPSRLVKRKVIFIFPDLARKHDLFILCSNKFGQAKPIDIQVEINKIQLKSSPNDIIKQPFYAYYKRY